MKPERIAQVGTSITRSVSRKTSATGYATLATGPSNAGAASSPTAANRKSPVVRLLKSKSQATSPCQPGTLVTSWDK